MKKMTSFNFDECKDMTAVKNKIRELMFEISFKAYCEIFGEENVSKVITDEKGTKEIAVALGTKTNSDGFNVEVCATAKFTAKEWEERKTSTGKRVEMFDREFSANEYIRILDEKAEKEKKAKEEKEKKAKEKQEEKERKRMEKEKAKSTETEINKITN